MSFSNTIVVFTLNDQEHALPLSIVESVVRSVEVTRIPNSHVLIFGLINFRGEIIPVINTRRCFGHPERQLNVQDRFIIVSVNHRKMALVVDSVSGIQTLKGDQESNAATLLPGSGGLTAVLKGKQNIILVHHLEELLNRAKYQFPNVEELAPKALRSHE